jgi:hypothetical protein
MFGWFSEKSDHTFWENRLFSKSQWSFPTSRRHICRFHQKDTVIYQRSNSICIQFYDLFGKSCSSFFLYHCIDNIQWFIHTFIPKRRFLSYIRILYRLADLDAPSDSISPRRTNAPFQNHQTNYEAFDRIFSIESLWICPSFEYSTRKLNNKHWFCIFSKFVS